MEQNLRFWLPMLLVMQIIQAVFITFLLWPTPTVAQLRHAQAVIFAHKE